MTFFDSIEGQAKARARRVVFPEGDSAEIQAAQTRLKEQGLCVPVPLVDQVGDHHIEVLVQNRGMKPALAKRLLSKPMYRAAAMVATGEADLMVAGVDTPTSRVIEAAHMVIGLADGVETASSFFLMVFPDGRRLLFSDCAVVVAPTAAQLASIATAAARSGAALLDEARVALLSFSTGTSGQGDQVRLVTEAAELSGFTGPVQADAALNPRIAVRKGAGAGDANVLVFPDLNAGNIAYKLCQELAGAQAIGPVLQGFRKPVCDLSRGASVDDIIRSTLIASIL